MSVTDDEARSHVPCDGGCHDPDRAGAGDQDVLTGQREGQGRVDRIAQRVEHRAQVGVHVVGLHPYVARRDHHVVGERTVAVDSHARRPDAHMTPAGPTVAAGPADDVPLAGSLLANLDRGDVLADLDDLAEELMTDHQGRLDHGCRPVIPLFEVQVGATQASPVHADLHVIGPDHRFGAIHQLESGTCGGLHQSSHGLDPSRRPEPRRAGVAS